MCIGCRDRFDKKELIRIVRTPENNVALDLTGKLSGRGAYICKGNEKCLEKAIKTKALERHLEINISDDLYNALKKGISESV